MADATYDSRWCSALETMIGSGVKAPVDEVRRGSGAVRRDWTNTNQRNLVTSQ